MAASSPTITAIIAARDEASPVIKNAVALAHKAADETAHLTEGASRTASAAMSRMSSLHAEAVASMSSRLGAFASKVDKFAAGAFAGFGAHFLHEASHIATEMSGLERKMQAFAGLSKEQADGIRRATDTTFSGSTGGPTGQMELATQLLNNGVRSDQLQGMMQPISLYAMETNQALGEAATEFAGHMAMLHRVHDDAGKEISIGSATPAQTKRAAEETFGALTTFFKQMQGSFKDVMEFSKVAAPSSNMLKVPEHFMFAEEAVLSQQGIRGEVAGTAVAGFNRRMIGRTAKSRAAMAEAGLNYSDYVDVDPTRITAKGVLDAFMQRAGTAPAKTIAAVNSSVAQFYKDLNLDKFNIALTDDFIGSGNKGLKNRVAASNAAGDITQGAITKVDQLKFLQDVKDKNVGFGLLQPMFRESTNAVLLMAQNVDELKRIRGEYDKADNQQTYDTAKKEQFDNYAGSQQNFHGAIAGAQDQFFQAFESPLTHAYNMAADGIRSVASAGESTKMVLDSVLLAGTAIGGLKTAGTLAEMAGGLMKFATGAEHAGPLVGALGLLADIPFIPVVAGIGAMVAAFEAFQHKAELWTTFENWRHGGPEMPEMPKTPEDLSALRAKVEADRAAITDRRATLDRNLPFDPKLDTLQSQLQGLITERRGRIDELPAVRDPLKAREAAERERPQTDPDFIAARDRLHDVQAQLRKRETIAGQDRRVINTDRAIEHLAGEDVNANDAELPRLRGQRADLRSKLPAGADSSPAIEALDAQIIGRLQANEDMHRRVMAAAYKLRDDALKAAGAPDISPVDVDTASQAKDDALARAQAKHDAMMREAQAGIDRARAQADAAIRQDPEVKDAQARVDTRRDEVRATAARTSGDDGKIKELEADIRRNEVALKAYEIAHPAFTRMGLDGLPTTMPDFSKASVPRTGPAFGVEGPMMAPPMRAPAVEGPAIPAANTIAAILDGLTKTRTDAAAGPREPQKVDVGVQGTVTGSAEVHNTTTITVEPSAYLTGVVRSVEHLATLNLTGKMGETMPTNSGVRPSAPAPVYAAGHPV